MIAFSRTVPNAWSEHDKLAKTTPGGMGIHAAVLDRDIGPLLQTQKLLDSVVFAKMKGYAQPLTAAELELMNFTGDGNGFDLVTMPQELREQVPTSNFFQRSGYERNPIARRTGTVAALFAAIETKMDRASQSPGARSWRKRSSEAHGRRGTMPRSRSGGRSCGGGNFSVLSAVALAVAWPLTARAQNWPAKPVKIVVAFAPGGAADLFARMLAAEMSTTFKQQFYVENIAGSRRRHRHRPGRPRSPDGYTLLIGGAGPLLTSPAINPNVGYDPLRDFTHIAMIAGDGYVLIANAASPAEDLRRRQAARQQGAA